MARFIRVQLVLFLGVLVLALGACGRRSRASAYGSNNGTNTTYSDTTTMPRRHHSIIAGAAAGAVAGHMMGHHAVTGAVVGAIVQHERNKHQR